MAITTKKPGVWGINQVYGKVNQNFIWEYPNGWWSWGMNAQGQVGQDNTTKYSSPVQIGVNKNWVSLSTDQEGGLAVDSQGYMWAVGDNQYGELGQNNRTDYSSPRQIPGDTWDASNTRSGSPNQHCVLKTDGTMWSWGYGDYGKLPTNGSRSSPIQIGSSSDWASTFTHTRGSGAIKKDGTLWMWGINAEGNLGQNNRTYYSSPQQIPGTTWKIGEACGNGNGILAIKTDGTMWKWGRGNDGTGANDRVNYSSPIQIPGSTWSSVGNGINHFLAIKTDGTLWGFAHNNNGQLGQNNVQPGDGGYSSPVQIGSDTNWKYAGSGMCLYSAAIKTDNTLWVWGKNNQGQLGMNNIISYSSPVQVPGSWTTTSHSYYQMYALRGG